jgi:integrase/recombinase XerD
MNELIFMYLEHMKDKSLSQNTIEAYMRDIKRYEEFLSSNNISIEAIDKMTVLSYVQELNRLGKSQSSIVRFIVSLRNFYKYLYKCGKISEIPIMEYEMPKVTREIPQVLTVDEVERLLNCPDMNTYKGKRDKAMLEVMYATGIKASEILDLELTDLNLKLGYLRCKGSKGRERIVPLGSYALDYLNKYLEVRSYLNISIPNLLFFNLNGEKMTRQGFWKIIKNYARMSQIDKEINLYTLRHAFAVHMIENGADMKSVQQLLGYKDVSAIQIYINMINKNRLGDVYKKAHPRA